MFALLHLVRLTWRLQDGVAGAEKRASRRLSNYELFSDVYRNVLQEHDMENSQQSTDGFKMRLFPSFGLEMKRFSLRFRRGRRVIAPQDINDQIMNIPMRFIGILYQSMI